QHSQRSMHTPLPDQQHGQHQPSLLNSMLNDGPSLSSEAAVVAALQRAVRHHHLSSEHSSSSSSLASDAAGGTLDATLDPEYKVQLVTKGHWSDSRESFAIIEGLKPFTGYQVFALP